jgi:hypothetical protein
MLSVLLIYIKSCFGFYLCPCRAKHPTKVPVWAGNSFRGATSICIFEGKMNASLFTSILEPTLLPFIDEEYSKEHILIMIQTIARSIKKFLFSFYSTAVLQKRSMYERCAYSRLRILEYVINTFKKYGFYGITPC